MQPEKRNILPLVRHHIKTQTPRTNQHHPQAFTAIINIFSFRIVHRIRILTDIFPVRISYLIPKRKTFLINRFHHFVCHHLTSSPVILYLPRNCHYSRIFYIAASIFQINPGVLLSPKYI